MIVVKALFALLLFCAGEAEEKNKRNATTLRLIAVLPLSYPPAPARWERGLEILPGARLAVDQVNSMAVLPGYELEIAVVDEAGCLPASSAVSLYEQVVGAGSKPSSTLGVVGVMCAAVAKAVQAVCGAPGVDLVQLLGGPSSRGWGEGPLAHGMVADSSAYADMSDVLLGELGMDTAGFAVLYSGGSDGYSYYLPMAEALARRIDDDGTKKKLKYLEQVDVRGADEVVAELRAEAIESAFVSLDVVTTARVLCAAGRANLVWPGFGWLLLDHEATELMEANQCSTMELAKGLEGAILLHRHLEPVEDNRKLVAGQTYQEYLKSLINYPPYSQSAVKPSINPYANVLYDAVWSVALALNNSLQSHPDVTNATLSEWVRKGLPSVSFNGTHDFVDFTRRGHSAGDHTVRVEQIISGNPVLLGHYYTRQDRLVMTNPVSLQGTQKLPHVELQYALISPIAVGVVLTFTGMVTILITAVLVLLLYYRRESEIKATSPKISIFMFIGCYMLCTAIGLEVAFRAMVITGKATKIVCNATVWPASIGINLILATLLVRLARVYYLFSRIRVLQKERELWTDRTLFCVVLLVVLGNILLLTIWAVVDNYHVEDYSVYLTASNTNNLSPVHQYCRSTYIMLWLPLLCLYSLFLIGAIIILTTLTRKIKRRHFKDTKKVNAFIFMSLMIFSIMIPLWWVSRYVNYTLSGMLLCLCYGITAVLCQMLLFVPKTIPPFIRHMFKTKLREEQLASSTDSEKRRPSLLRKMSSTAI